MEIQRLKNPPIREAVFDLKFPPDELLTLDDIRKIGEEVIKPFFPIQNEMFQITLESSFSPGGKQMERKDSLNANGIRFQDKENNWVFQLRTNGITLSRLKNYSSWEEIKDLGFKLLECIKKYHPNKKVNRIAARYINDFQLSFKDDIIDNNLVVVPKIPDKLPKIVDAFSIQLILSKEEYNLKAILNEAIVPIAPNKNFYNIVLDIDVFKTNDYNLNEISKIKDEFNNIRAFKNEIFFNSLTEETLSLFNK